MRAPGDITDGARCSSAVLVRAVKLASRRQVDAWVDVPEAEKEAGRESSAMRRFERREISGGGKGRRVDESSPSNRALGPCNGNLIPSPASRAVHYEV